MSWHDLLLDLLHRYGYVFVAVVVFIESTGIPAPAESMLVAASIYAATSHRFDPVLLAVAACSGAILGDNLGYLIGRSVGTPILVRYGRHVGLNERRLRLGRYLFRLHGGKVVFFGRFMALLRTFAALLAGANRMEWRSFLLWNAAGGIVWGCFYSLVPYLLGDAALRLAGPFGIAIAAVAIVVIVYAVLFVRRHEHRLALEAEAAEARAAVPVP